MQIKRGFSSLKLGDFTTLHAYLTAAAKENPKIDFEDFKPQLIGTLPDFPSDISNRPNTVNARNLDAFVIRSFAVERNSAQLLRYHRYLEAENRKIFKPLYELFLKAWGSNLEGFSAEEKSEIAQIARKWMEEMPHIAVIKSRAISTLALCGHVEEAFELLNQKKEKDVILDFSASLTILKMALEKDLMKIFWELFESDTFHCEMQQYKDLHPAIRQSQDEVYVQYVEKFKDNSKEMEKLFVSFAKHSTFIGQGVEKSLQKNFGWRMATSPRYAKCHNCKERLPPHKITKEDCQLIATSLKDALFSDEIYKNSRPDEVRKFEEFLTRDLNTDFDIVVDGLNVGFSNSNVTNSNKYNHVEESSRVLLIALKQLKEKGFKNILLVHRHWLQRTKYVMQIQDLCSKMLLLEKLTSDDPFAIIAALHFGPRTNICTNDLFRQYSNILPNSYINNRFLHWLYQNRVTHRARRNIRKEAQMFEFWVNSI